MPLALLKIPPPSLILDEFPLIVQSVPVSGPLLYMPPPLDVAVFPLNAELTTVVASEP